jgi:AMP-binding enzyme
MWHSPTRARASGALRELGVRAGDRVALWLPNVPAWLALLFACARLGAIAVSVNTRFKSHEVADIVGRSRRAAKARVASMCSGRRAGKSSRIYCTIMPPARYSNMSYTVIRVPTIQSFPLRMPGLPIIHFSRSIVFSRLDHLNANVSALLALWTPMAEYFEAL